MSESTTLRKEINSALKELLKNPKVLLLGESIKDAYGGANKVTRGLKGEIYDMPICEQAQVGYAIGAGMTGRIVILEIMFANFLSLCVSQIMDVGKVLEDYHDIRFKLIIRAVTNNNELYGPNHSGDMRWLLDALDVPVYQIKKGNALDTFQRAIKNEYNINIIIEEKTQYGT